MVNKANGNVFEVMNIPLISPSKKYFLTHFASLMFSDQNGLQLVEITPGGLKEKFKDLALSQSYEEVKWVDDKTLAVKILDISNSKGIFGWMKIK